jgi:hypothetical protein
MGLTHVTVRVKKTDRSNWRLQADFVVDTGATDSLAPAAELNKVGIRAVGKTVTSWLVSLKNMNLVSPKSASWAK